MDIPQMIAGRYRVLRELGRGGMGAVYLVEHAHTGEHLALKVLHASFGANPAIVERFKREARAPARIRSEHVVRVTDADVAFELGGAPFLVMEALEGADLDRTLKERGALPAHEVVWILRQVGIALDKAHAMGIVHRDLKPENLFLHRRDDGTVIVKILDFGISKSVGADDIAGAGLTKTGAMMGTPLYMSPEQARGQTSLIGPPTDIWAIGHIAFTLLTGAIYWSAESMTDLLVQIVTEPMKPPSQLFPALGPGLDAWFAKSCDRDPSKRWATVGEQVAALARALGVENVAGTHPGPMPIAVPKTISDAPRPSQLGNATASAMSHSAAGQAKADSSGRKTAIGLGIGLAVLLGLGGVAVFLRSSKQAVDPHTTGSSVPTVPAPPTPATAPSPTSAPTSVTTTTGTSSPAVTASAAASTEPSASAAASAIPVAKPPQQRPKAPPTGDGKSKPFSPVAP